MGSKGTGSRRCRLAVLVVTAGVLFLISGDASAVVVGELTTTSPR